MATVSFSVPEDVKNAFKKAFEGENKSAVLTLLMRQAVEERKRKKRRALAVDALLQLRHRIRPATAAATSRARRKGRP